MAEQRIKGQEVVVAVILDGQLQTQIDSIQSAEFTVLPWWLMLRL